MKIYILTLGAGLLVGIIYSLLNVRSPAPPLIALLGLLGMLIGEQIIPVGKQLIAGTVFSTACTRTETINHIFGQLPGRQTADKKSSIEEKDS
ncbi:XapX domain-containing protein [Serratia sp. UGAL515B_01]|uniref:XapX domain-containing protein n=1 Tax=Serratia sp. UGAL515B_01 TaxID=2986763 RepID=UPI002953F798|nr:XapX domain-containing protein [Serratia sp. UGAL515B_01]WON77732.1 XapX domain-containing protein [Serratia sp. UGAL515B_01]